MLPPASKPWWQQATALVSLGAGGVVTGLSFVPKASADVSSPASMPINLLALKHSVRNAGSGDARLRSAIVNVANYYRAAGRGEIPGRDGSADLAARQHRWCQPRPVLRCFRQPHAASRVPGGRRAELGHRRVNLSLAIARLGRRAGGPQPRVARCHLDRAGRARRTIGGTRSVLATGPSPGTGCSSTGTSRWSPNTPAACCTRWALTRCRTTRSTPTSTLTHCPARGWSGSSTTARSGGRGTRR